MPLLKRDFIPHVDYKFLKYKFELPIRDKETDLLKFDSNHPNYANVADYFSNILLFIFITIEPLQTTTVDIKQTQKLTNINSKLAVPASSLSPTINRDILRKTTIKKIEDGSTTNIPILNTRDSANRISVVRERTAKQQLDYSGS